MSDTKHVFSVNVALETTQCGRNVMDHVRAWNGERDVHVQCVSWT